MSDHYNSDQWLQCIALAKAMRAEFLESFVGLEKMIDFYLAFHFCPDPTDGTLAHELMDAIICTDRITFESKRQVFQFLVKKHNPGFYEKHKTIFSDLTEFMQTRNILAHYSIYTGTDAVESFTQNGNITFIKFKNDRSLITFTKEDIDDKISAMVEHSEAIADLLAEKFPMHTT